MIESHIPCDSGHFGEWLAAMGSPANGKLSSEGLLLEPTTPKNDQCIKVVHGVHKPLFDEHRPHLPFQLESSLNPQLKSTSSQ